MNDEITAAERRIEMKELVTQVTNLGTQIAVTNEIISTIDERTEKLDKIVLGNGQEGLTTKARVNRTSINRLWGVIFSGGTLLVGLIAAIKLWG